LCFPGQKSSVAHHLDIKPARTPDVSTKEEDCLANGFGERHRHHRGSSRPSCRIRSSSSIRIPPFQFTQHHNLLIRFLSTRLRCGIIRFLIPLRDEPPYREPRLVPRTPLNHVAPSANLPPTIVVSAPPSSYNLCYSPVRIAVRIDDDRRRDVHTLSI
jgi:hypothetical protein